MASRGTRRFERYLPLSYFVVAVVLTVVALPSVLRPNQQVTQSAELSPDAPPDDEQQSIISALNRANSATAGSTEGVGDGAGVGLERPAVTAVPRACPRGSGLPPRQVESVYAGPCAGPFRGTNGGATWKGVTETEIRIGVRSTASRPSDNRPSVTGECYPNGPIDAIPREDMSEATYTWWVFQEYFNRTFQFYGRQLRFYCVSPTGNGDVEENAQAAQADEEYRIFATPYQLAPEACNEYARRQIISFCEYLPHSYYANRGPMVWGGKASISDIADWSAEYWCRNLVGKKAEFADDSMTQSQTRKFAVLALNGRGYQESAAAMQEAARRHCGIDVVVLSTGNATPDQLTNAMVKARSEGVTTIMPMVMFYDVLLAGSIASGQGYFPEWWVSDFGLMTRNFVGQLANPSSWTSAFGITAEEPEREFSGTECYRAFRTVDQDRQPHGWLCGVMWRNLVLMATGIQMAGPTLTPTTFQKGWYDLGLRFYGRPSWAVGGGFGPGRHTYPRDVSLVWWNSGAPDPSDRSRVGAYSHLYDARRFCPGHLPGEDSMAMWFREGVTEAPDRDVYDVPPPRPTCQ